MRALLILFIAILIFQLPSFAYVSTVYNSYGTCTIYLDGDSGNCTSSSPCSFDTIAKYLTPSEGYAPQGNKDYFTETTTNFAYWNTYTSQNVSSITLGPPSYLGSNATNIITASNYAKVVLGNWSSQPLNNVLQPSSATELRFSVYSNTSMNISIAYLTTNGNNDKSYYRYELYFENNSVQIPAGVWTNVSLPLITHLYGLVVEYNTAGATYPPQPIFNRLLEIRFYINSSGPANFSIDGLYFYVPIRFDKVSTNTYKTNCYLMIGNTNFTNFKSKQEKLILSAPQAKDGKIEMRFQSNANVSLGGFHEPVEIEYAPTIPITRYWGNYFIYFFTPNVSIDGLYAHLDLANQGAFCRLQYFANYSPSCRPQDSCCVNAHGGTSVQFQATTPAPSWASVKNVRNDYNGDGVGILMTTPNLNYTFMQAYFCGDGCYFGYGGNYDKIIFGDTMANHFVFYNGQGTFKNAMPATSQSPAIRGYAYGAMNITFKAYQGDINSVGVGPRSPYIGAWQEFKFTNDLNVYVYDMGSNKIANATIDIYDNNNNKVATLTTDANGFATTELIHKYMWSGWSNYAGMPDWQWSYVMQNVPNGTQNWVLVENASKFSVGDNVSIVCTNYSQYVYQWDWPLKIVAINGNNLTMNRTIVSQSGSYNYANCFDTVYCRAVVRKAPPTGGWQFPNMVYSPYRVEISKTGYQNQTFFLNLATTQNLYVFLSPPKFYETFWTHDIKTNMDNNNIAVIPLNASRNIINITLANQNAGYFNYTMQMYVKAPVNFTCDSTSCTKDNPYTFNLTWNTSKTIKLNLTQSKSERSFYTTELHVSMISPNAVSEIYNITVYNYDKMPFIIENTQLAGSSATFHFVAYSNVSDATFYIDNCIWNFTNMTKTISNNLALFDVALSQKVNCTVIYYATYHDTLNNQYSTDVYMFTTKIIQMLHPQNYLLEYIYLYAFLFIDLIVLLLFAVRLENNYIKYFMFFLALLMIVIIYSIAQANITTEQCISARNGICTNTIMQNSIKFDATIYAFGAALLTLFFVAMTDLFVRITKYIMKKV